MTHTAFSGTRHIASGPLADVALAVRSQDDVLIFDDSTGRQIDIDTRGSEAEIRARFDTPARGRGRPKLGVMSREISLLPRHWDWLAAQPGGPSVALRKLVEAAGRDPRRARAEARDAAYRFASAMAGNAVGFEEAMRALYNGRRELFIQQMAYWPADVRAHLERLTEAAFESDKHNAA